MDRKDFSGNAPKFSDLQQSENEAQPQGERAILTTCIETIGGDPNTALRLSFQIKVF